MTTISLSVLRPILARRCVMGLPAWEAMWREIEQAASDEYAARLKAEFDKYYMYHPPSPFSLVNAVNAHRALVHADQIEQPQETP